MNLNISELYKQYTQKQHFNNTVGGKHAVGAEPDGELMTSLREPDLVAAQQLGMNTTMQNYLSAGPQRQATAATQ